MAANRASVTARGFVENEDLSGGVDDKPRSVYEMMTRQMLEQVKNDVAEVKGRVNTLLWLVVGATLLEIITKMVK